MVGTVNEDFAVESLAGDIFQLGNTSYRIRASKPAACASRMRTDSRRRSRSGWAKRPGAPTSCRSPCRGCAPTSSRHPDRATCAAIEHLASLRASRPRPEDSSSTISSTAHAALGAMPTHTTIVLERFFDESGGMQLVIHSPFGSRINRAWGLALRKRFCVKFNFELQAAATEDAIVLSLSTSHSFELAAVARYLHSNTVRDVLIQAMLDRADVRRAVALDRGHLARAAALSRRQESSGAAATHARRRSHGVGVPRPDRVRREHRRRARDSRSSARPPDGSRLPVRGDGHRRARAPVARHRSGRHRDRRARPAHTFAARARDPDRAAVRLPRRRAARGAPHAGGDGAALARCRRPPPTWAGSTPPRSSACARKRGRRPATPTSCTTRCSASGSCLRTEVARKARLAGARRRS